MKCDAVSGIRAAAKSRRNLVLSLFLVTAAVSPLVGQQPATLQGIVTAVGSGQPLQGANVIVRGSGLAPRATLTDRNGFYIVPGLAAGSYTVQATYLGHSPFEGTV